MSTFEQRKQKREDSSPCIWSLRCGRNGGGIFNKINYDFVPLEVEDPRSIHRPESISAIGCPTDFIPLLPCASLSAIDFTVSRASHQRCATKIALLSVSRQRVEDEYRKVAHQPPRWTMIVGDPMRSLMFGGVLCLHDAVSGVRLMYAWSSPCNNGHELRTCADNLAIRTSIKSGTILAQRPI